MQFSHEEQSQPTIWKAMIFVGFFAVPITWAVAPHYHLTTPLSVVLFLGIDLIGASIVHQRMLNDYRAKDHMKLLRKHPLGSFRKHD